jgi:hypothetical protein
MSGKDTLWSETHLPDLRKKLLAAVDRPTKSFVDQVLALCRVAPEPAQAVDAIVEEVTKVGRTVEITKQMSREKELGVEGVGGDGVRL